MITTCLWASKPIECTEIFHPSLTDEGLCCSFNRLKSELIFRNPKDTSDLNVIFKYPSANWTPEDGYPLNTPFIYMPWRPLGAGNHLGLTIVLDAEVDEYYCSSEVSYGFKVQYYDTESCELVMMFDSYYDIFHLGNVT